MNHIGLILWVFAFVFFAAAALWNDEPRRTRLIAGGLAFLAFAGILGDSIFK